MDTDTVNIAGKGGRNRISLRLFALLLGLVGLLLAAGVLYYLTVEPFTWRLCGFAVGLLFIAYRSIAYAKSKSS